MLVLALLFNLVSAATSGQGTIGWGNSCWNNVTNQSDVGLCYPGYTFCQTDAPSPNTQTRDYTACWCRLGADSGITNNYCCGKGANPTSGCPSGLSVCTWNQWCSNKWPGQGVVCNLTNNQCGVIPNGPAMIESAQAAQEMPVSSAVALIFVAFFVGIILSYVVYKFRKNMNKKYSQPQQALSESSRQSAEDSHLGERPLNVAPLSEQV